MYEGPGARRAKCSIVLLLLPLILFFCPRRQKAQSPLSESESESVSASAQLSQQPPSPAAAVGTAAVARPPPPPHPRANSHCRQQNPSSLQPPPPSPRSRTRSSSEVELRPQRLQLPFTAAASTSKAGSVGLTLSIVMSLKENRDSFHKRSFKRLANWLNPEGEGSTLRTHFTSNYMQSALINASGRFTVMYSTIYRLQ